MALWLRALSAFAEDGSSVSSTHIRQFTSTCNSSSRGSDAFLHVDTSSVGSYILDTYIDTCKEKYFKRLLKRRGSTT